MSFVFCCLITRPNVHSNDKTYVSAPLKYTEVPKQLGTKGAQTGTTSC